MTAQDAIAEGAGSGLRERRAQECSSDDVGRIVDLCSAGARMRPRRGQDDHGRPLSDDDANRSHAALRHGGRRPRSTFGASGAIAAALGAFFVLYPTARIRTLVLVFFVQIPACLYQLVEGNFGLSSASANGGGGAFFAYVGGFLFGAFVTATLLNAGRVAPRAGQDARPFAPL